MIYEIDPLTDPRWPEFLSRRPDASVFHTRGWLETVYRTYGCKPAGFTTCEPGSDLTNGLVLCRVHSWLTGRRFVSLPFSDHCEPLVTGSEDLVRLLMGIEKAAVAERCDYVELRPTSPLTLAQSEWRTSQGFCLHRLDLRPGTAAVFRGLHRDCIRRKIRRAEKEGIKITEGRDLGSLKRFHSLVLQTRRRQGLPPQPMVWFTNLVACLGDSVRIRFACRGCQPIAGILTLQYGKSVYYKYGASLARFHRLGPMPYLFWSTIQDAIDSGMEELDMGRSDYDNVGLVTFKDRWSAARSALRYWRSPANGASPPGRHSWARRVTGVACRYMPDRCLSMLGTLSYSHID